jgi:hypothetical protein
VNLFVMRPAEASISQFGVRMPSYRSDWLWPPYSSEEKRVAEDATNAVAVCGPESASDGSPKKLASKRWFELACQVNLPAYE